MALRRPPASSAHEAEESATSVSNKSGAARRSQADKGLAAGRPDIRSAGVHQTVFSFIYTFCGRLCRGKLYRTLYKLSYKTGKMTIASAAVLRGVAKNLWQLTLAEGVDRFSRLLFTLTEYKSSRVGRGELSITRATARVIRNIADAVCSSFKTAAADGPIEGLKLLAGRAYRAAGQFWSKNRRAFNVAAPLAGAAMLALTVYIWSNMSLGVMLTYNGVKIGVVNTDLDYHNAVTEIETRVANASGQTFKLNKSVGYELVFAKKSDFIATDKLYDKILMASGSVVYEGYGLYVDGRLIGSNDDGPAIQQMLSSILEPYKAKAGSASIGFVQNVKVQNGIFPSSVDKPVDTMKAELTSNISQQQNYTVKKGDTPIAVASMFHLSLDQLYGMNPSVSKEGLYQGETVVVESAQPMLTVKLVKNEVFEENIPFGVDRANSSSIYKGQTQVASAGANGQKQIVAAVTYVNGVATSKKTLSETVVKRPVNQKVLVGTKPKPATVASGHFTWPCYGSGGYISCGFWGYTGHTGVDYAVSQGTPIKAADAGTVIFAGWDGGYGNCVRISHGNGFVTLYGHCSRLEVHTGERVFKGQEIARVGHTGHVIGNPGNHVHFEIQVNGTAVNPLRYVRP